MHRPRIAKSNLDLGRMHVDIDSTGIEREVEDIGGLPVMMKHILIGLAQRVGEQSVAHIAAVHIDVLCVARRARVRRLRNQAAQSEVGRLLVDRQCRLIEILAQQLLCARFPTLPRQVPAYPPVVAQREGDIRARQRDAPESFLAVAVLRRFRLQKLAPGRRIEVQIADGDRGALHLRARHGFARLCIFRIDLPPM